MIAKLVILGSILAVVAIVIVIVISAAHRKSVRAKDGPSDVSAAGAGIVFSDSSTCSDASSSGGGCDGGGST